ncbi:hypothetical protein ACFW7J_00135 [Streptomyces sp. NPDC059525]|uniref:hypothetical protein n=1 Tax=Streptomyces sp. NPDC059525 TaxID=3346857 RepID=UPI00369470A1
MTSLARLPLDGGGCVLVNGPAATEGPVKAGRIGDAMRDLPETLEQSLDLKVTEPWKHEAVSHPSPAAPRPEAEP